MTTLFFDPISGAAGDMVLGALIDAGAPPQVVREAVGSLGLEGWDLTTATVFKAGVRSTRALVTTTPGTHARSYRDIRALISGAPLREPVKRRALATFEVLGRAEARVHDTALDDVHFHEVGGLDAIVDIVGSSAALDHFAPASVITGPLPLGSGITGGAHGPLPVPAPAVIEILAGAVVYGHGDTELVTPTGAAILKANSTSFGELPPLRATGVGYGAGAGDLADPNVLRVIVGEEAGSRRATSPGLILETNLDDLSPELLPHVIEQLLKAGAQDAWLTPILMKKGRPAFTLSVLTDETERSTLLEIIYTETTTLGVRSIAVDKDVLEREWIPVEVAGRPVSLKIGRRAGRIVTMAPEYEDARRAAESSGLPLKEIQASALRAGMEATQSHDKEP